MKEEFKKHKYRIASGLIIVFVLAGAFWYGGGSPSLRGWDVQMKSSLSPTVSSGGADFASDRVSGQMFGQASDQDLEYAFKLTPEGVLAPTDENGTLAKEPVGEASSEGVYQANEDYSKSQGMQISTSTGMDGYLTAPVPDGKPTPVEPQNAVITDKKLACRLSVRCDTILDNMNWLEKEKWELVPSNGVIFAEKSVTFYEGESVFNLLQREMKEAKIHMEFMNTPMYNSAYIEGINNLYEFDVGELSGWMYKVNGWFPNYGCSRYLLRPGDVVEWIYTCDLGRDVGGYYSVGSQNGK